MSEENKDSVITVTSPYRVRRDKNKRVAIIGPDRITYRGMTALAKRCFWPYWTYDAVASAAAKQKQSASENKAPVAPTVAANRGKRLGIRVHLQMQIIIEQKLDLRETVKKRTLTLNEDNKKKFKVKTMRLHVYTVGFCCELVKLKIRPIATELPVGYAPIRVGTLIDFLGIHEVTGQYHVIQFKTGRANYALLSTGHDMAGLTGISDCAQNQDLIQATLDFCMFRATFRSIPPKQLASPLTMTANKNGVRSVEVPAKWDVPLIWELFCKSVRGV